MVHVERFKVKGKQYYKLVHNLRVEGKVKSKSQYLGKELPSPKALEKLKEAFLQKVRKEREHPSTRNPPITNPPLPTTSPHAMQTFIRNPSQPQKGITLFDRAPVPLLEQDWSQVKTYLESLQAKGNNLAPYFEKHPSQLGYCLSLMKITNVNLACLHLLECATKNDVPSMARIIPEHSLQDFKNILIDLVRQRRTYVVQETSIQTLQEKTKQAQVRVDVLLTDWSRVEVAFIDITTWKLKERELSTAYNALNTSINGVIITDAQGVITYVNSSFSKLFGYPSKHFVLGKTITSLLSTEVKEGKTLEELQQQKVTELTFKRIDGTSFTVQISASAITDEEGNIIGRMAAFADITPQVETKEKLRKAKERVEQQVQERTRELSESESKHRSLVESLPQMVYTADPETLTPTFVNIQVELILGYSKVQWLSNPLLWKKIIHHKDKKETIQLINQAKLKRMPLDITYRIQRRNGSLGWVKNIITWQRNTEGKIIAMHGLITDITNIKEAQDKFVDLFKFAPVAMLEKDYSALKQYLTALNLKTKDQIEKHFKEHPQAVQECINMVKVNDINQETLHLFNTDTQENFLSTYYSKQFCRESNTVFVQEMIALAQNKRAFKAFMEVFTLDGKRKRVTLKWTVPELYKGTYQKVMASLVDISLQRQFSEVVQVKNYAIESSNTGIIITDLSGKVTYANQAFYTLWNIHNVKEVLNQKVHAYLPHPKGAPFVLHHVHLNKTWKGHFTLKKDRAVTHLETTGTLIEDKFNEPLGMVFSYMDITEHMKTEQIRLEFTNIAAHELKTPITPLKTFLTMMNDTPKKFGVNKEGRKFLEVCMRNVNRLNVLIGDILDISRLEAKGMKFKMATFDLRKILRQRVEDFQQEMINKGLKLRVKVGKLPLLYGDEQRIGEVVGNLLKNAVNFTDVGSIFVEAAMKQGQVKVKIVDTGVGIGKDTQEKLFTKFFQAQDITTRKHKGSGLGLAICKGIIEAHGGEIRAFSEGKGKGTTFTFTLPVKQGKDVKAAGEVKTKKSQYQLLGDKVLLEGSKTKKQDNTLTVKNTAGTAGKKQAALVQQKKALPVKKKGVQAQAVQAQASTMTPPPSTSLKPVQPSAKKEKRKKEKLNKEREIPT
jgi:PAS domain S-box-containing protein